MTTLRREQLTFGPRVGAGAQGTLYRVAKVTGADFPFPLVFKEFSATTTVSGPGLQLLTRLRDTLSPDERNLIDRTTVWPCAVVEELGKACGYVMQAIPDRFMQPLSTSSGRELVPREVQHLLVPEEVQRRTMGEVPTTAERMVLAREMAFVLGFLHAKDLVYGDLSYKNAVFTIRPRPELMLLDCDGIRKVGQAAAMPQLHSPGWNPPESGPQTKDTDRYKLGLFILRCLCPNANAQTRDPEVAAGILDPTGLGLLRRSLGDDPKTRTTGREWVEHLDRAVARAGGVAARSGSAPAPPRPARQQSAEEARRQRAHRAPARVRPYVRPQPPVLLGQGPRPRPHRVRPAQVHTTSRPRVWNRFTSASTASGRPTGAQTAIVLGWFVVLGLAALGAVAGLVLSSSSRSSGSSSTVVPPTTLNVPLVFDASAGPAVDAASAAVNDPAWVPVSVSTNGSYGPRVVTDDRTGLLTEPAPRWLVQFGPAALDLPSGSGSVGVRNLEVVPGSPPAELAQGQVAARRATPGTWRAPVLPAGWPEALDRATARVSTSTRVTEPAEVAYQCDLSVSASDDCVWSFRFRRPDGTLEDVFVLADGSRTVPRPRWYRPPCREAC